MNLGPATPIFRIFDEERARDFYIRWLGFDLQFEHRFGPDMPLYLGLERDDFVLHLSEHYGDTTPGTRVRVRCEDLAALHAALAARPQKNLRLGSPQEQPWGDLQLTVLDPFGNRLTFYQEAI
ncbi:glyoxalase superfamily protein [Yoonia litorea]|uniref:Bleomycin resistance protein n=1 Tax=Yoonia litorea TaxID=1123755 RepID=A0A1I6LME4_9RHOB|nr:glyoxalase superfamily protein [Yoonia litorea]SFS04654.1 Uncharacterized conserved protein PhnB, glyoxalase superfamily [Yoonia litorea]